MAGTEETSGAGTRDELRIGLLGCGNVGAALLDILDADAGAIASRSGVRLSVRRVAVRDLGAYPSADARFTTDAAGVVADPDIDLVVELIGGIEPARTLIATALASGKPVVSANKELLAQCAAELDEAARTAGVPLLFEAAVAGAIPLLRALQVSLVGEPVIRVMGIVNGTTNYILSRMSEDGISYAEALEAAQRLGYAERDPSADVTGSDAAAKAAILAGIAFNARVVASDVYTEGIEAVDVADIDFAHRLGYEVKLLAVVDCEEATGGVAAIGARVHPAMVPVGHPLAAVRGAYNAVFVEGANSGELMFYGRGAGGGPTASAVLGDVLDAARGTYATRPPRRSLLIRPIDELRTQYYLAIDVLDRPGVLAQVATLFGEHRVSIRLMEQVDRDDEARLVFITHLAREADLQATLAALRSLDSVRRVGSVLRVIGPEQ